MPCRGVLHLVNGIFIYITGMAPSTSVTYEKVDVSPKITWYEANDTCANQGKQLLKIESEAFNTEIKNAIGYVLKCSCSTHSSFFPKHCTSNKYVTRLTQIVHLHHML